MKNVVTVSEVSHPKCIHACLYPGEDGRRKRKYFTNETDALDFANKRREELGINGSAFGTINDDERAALACWRAFATDQAAPDLLVVIRHYVKEWKTKSGSVTITKALKRYVEHIEAEGASDCHVTSVKSRIGRLVTDQAHGKTPR